MALMDWSPDCFDSGVAGAAKVPTIVCLESLFKNLVNAIIALTGVALFIMLVVGGFNLLFSAGDQKKLEQAQHTITNAVIGLIVIVSAYLILQVIHVFTGVDVTKFNVIVTPP